LLLASDEAKWKSDLTKRESCHSGSPDGCQTPKTAQHQPCITHERYTQYNRGHSQDSGNCRLSNIFYSHARSRTRKLSGLINKSPLLNNHIELSPGPTEAHDAQQSARRGSCPASDCRRTDQQADLNIQSSLVVAFGLLRQWSIQRTPAQHGHPRQLYGYHFVPGGLHHRCKVRFGHGRRPFPWEQ